MKRYNPKDIEPKWQQQWADSGVYQAKDFDDKPKFVMLTEFPYPSGDGLHLGHTREYTLGDSIARYKRMNGFNVLYPMGFDAFGLPTENYAIKNKIAPQVATARNVSNFQKQFESLGLSIDWSRSFRTTDPEYYKWTQWLFLKFYEKGLAYQADISINWCPKCKTGLANEEVSNGRHERCDTLVERKQLKQWLLKITDYADRLIEGLKTVDYPSRIADQQINWIGRSKGAEIDFAVVGYEAKLRVFTTRPDTLFGVTFMVLAPEHPLVEVITTAEHKGTVNSYIKGAQAKSEIERQDTNREKTGAFTGAHAINPATDEKIPIWIADYVLTGYGTGAIMAVPAHDERDKEFADQFDLPIRSVVTPEFGKPRDNEQWVDGATVLVYDETTGHFLGLDWEAGWTGLVAGGINDGETYEDCARRELREEAGISNIVELIPLGDPVFAHYEHKVKGGNRIAKTQGFLAVINDRQGQETHHEAHETFTTSWYTGQELYEKVEKRLTGNDHWLEEITRALDCAEARRTGKSYVFDPSNVAKGIVINSGLYDGLSSEEAKTKIVTDLAAKGLAEEKVNYRLRDWIFSRQHYWGEPIPIIHCDEHGAVPVPADQLPVTLPAVENYEPTDTGESPLASITEWVTTTCPTCGKPAKRETDTMPNWAGSSWYYLRYFDAHNDAVFADRKKLDYWGAVDLYLGGMEHTTLHLLYSRFWHQFFYDLGLVPTPEPYAARRGQGIILAADGTKMSKSKGNIVNPTEVIDSGYGADAVRLTILFLAPYDQTTPWSPEGVAGTYRFINRFWNLVQDVTDAEVPTAPEAETALRVTMTRVVKRVSDDLAGMGFNTAISAMMEAVNDLYKLKSQHGVVGSTWHDSLRIFTQLLAPFAPHVSEELWQQLGGSGSVHVSQWPTYDAKYLVTDTVTVVVQINGKLRGQVAVPSNADQQQVIAAINADEKIMAHLNGAEPKKTIYVPGKLVNFVV